MEFVTSTPTIDVEIYGIADLMPELKEYAETGSCEIENPQFTINWNVELECREWGVKDICWYVTDITGSFDVVTFDGAGDEYERKTVEFDFEPFRESVLMEIEVTEWKQISINSIEIDYSTKTIAIS